MTAVQQELVNTGARTHPRTHISTHIVEATLDLSNVFDGGWKFCRLYNTLMCSVPVSNKLIYEMIKKMYSLPQYILFCSLHILSHRKWKISILAGTIIQPVNVAIVDGGSYILDWYIWYHELCLPRPYDGHMMPPFAHKIWIEDQRLNIVFSYLEVSLSLSLI